jgi:4'-phosphopantetheinyl transferase
MVDICINWPMPPSNLLLKPFEIHVYAADLRQTTEQMVSFEKVLSSDELDRSNWFHLVRDRRRFIAGRGILRVILARYLHNNPSQIIIDYNYRGKPFLLERDKHNPLYFNLSHSEDLAIFAVTNICNIGIDVEHIRPIKDAKSIATRFFSPSENDGIKYLSEHQENLAFFNLWTCKEAWFKATGDGIDESMNQIEVSFLPNEQPRIIRLFGNEDAAQKWSLFELRPSSGFIGSLAVPEKNVRVTCWHWLE